MKTIASFLILFLSGFATSVASAQEISNVKGNRALVDSVAPGTAVGDRFVVRDGDGKAKALVEVKQVKNNKAIVQVLKGRPQKGQGLTPYRGRTGAVATGSTRSGTSTGRSWGLLLGYSMDSMTIKSSGQSVSMTGSSLDLSGYFQTVIDGSFGARILGGYETMDVSGTGSLICDGNKQCSAKIGYLGIQGLLTYSFVSNSTMDLWAGAGLGFLYAMQKEANAIDTAKLSTNQTILLSFGMDYKLSPTMSIPFEFDYALYPETNASSANQMNFRVGVGWGF